ncbi:GTPase activating protein [Borealophlyctis nickersoniae]|nr:GTPase activating protein [Borealophlyctis nickersoniae]
MADDPVGNAVREARWSVLERFARVAKFTREIAGTTEVSEPEVGDARIVGTSNSDTPQTRPTFSPARIHLARWAYAWRRVRARDAQLRLNQPPPSLDDIEGLSASYSILAASALDDGGSTVWDETGEVETDLGTFEVWSSEQTDQTPPSQTVSRTAPLSAAEWNAFFDSKTGRIVVSEKDIRKRIFSGGLGLEIRAEAWKFLLGMYPWDSTASERAVIRESKA